MYWDSEEKPLLIRSIEKYNSPKLYDWDVRFLNRETIHKYIYIHDLPPKLSSLKTQHQSDWFRLYLLHKYGGCWLDASIIINDADGLNKLWEESMIQKSIFTGCMTWSIKQYKHVSGRSMPLNIDNWFIMAPPNSYIINLWFNEFEKAINMGFLEYKKIAKREHVNMDGIMFTNESDVYLTQHICIQKVFQKRIQTIPSILLFDSDHSFFKIQTQCAWENQCFQDTLLHDPASKQLPFIKLTQKERQIDLLDYFK